MSLRTHRTHPAVHTHIHTPIAGSHPARAELGAISGPRQSVMKPKPKQSVTSEVRKERGKTMMALDDILSSLPGEEPGLDPNANFAPTVAPIQYQAGAPRRAAVETSYTATCA